MAPWQTTEKRSAIDMPLGRDMWKPLIDRFRQRLATWKRKYLTKGGRLVLIKSTLASLPVYFPSLFVVPVSVAEEIELIMRNFLWGSNPDARRYHLLAWEKVCTPIELGGLGIRRIVEINAALLNKWVWNFGIQDGKLWKRVISEKYGCSYGGWFTIKSLPTHGCSLWRGIMSTEHIIRTNGKLRIGNGNRISFWNDFWLGNGALVTKFPRLFAVSTAQNGSVSAHRKKIGTNVEWDLQFRRSLLDREIGELAQLLQDLEQVTVVDDDGDRLIWQEGIEEFGSKVVYQYLEGIRMNMDQSRCIGFPFKKVWLKEVPSKVDFFIWAVYRGRTLTTDNLRKRGKSMPLRCILCGKEEESISHLFLKCDTSIWIWNWLLGSFGTQVDRNTDFKGWFQSRSSGRCSRVGILIWKVLFHATTWSLWLERNQRIFEEKANTKEKVLQNVILCIWNWIKFDPVTRGLRFEDLVFNWTAVISSVD